MKIALLSFFAVIFSTLVTFGQFAKDDQIKLTRDEPLYFRENVYRQGRKGELFSVLQYRADTRKVYVLGTDNSGKPFALAISDSAVAIVPRDAHSSLSGGVLALAKGDFALANAQFDEATKVDPSLRLATQLSAHVGALSDGIAALAKARGEVVRLQPEIERRLKNAAVADHPNPLSQDNSNQVRAAEIRNSAETLHAQLQQNVEVAEKNLCAAIEAARATSSELDAAGCFSLEIAYMGAIDQISSRYVPNARMNDSRAEFHKRELASRVASAENALAQVRKDRAAHKLVAAAEHASDGLRSEPGKYELVALKAEVTTAKDEVDKSFAKAIALKEQKQFEAALALAKSAAEECIDDDRLNDLLVSLEKMVADETKQIETARTEEKASNIAAAYEIYETYGMDADCKRLVPALAKQEEGAGNFLDAYNLYARIGASADMERLRKLKDDQGSAYESAKTAVVEGRFDDALVIYDKYKDVKMRRSALLQKAVFLEGKRDFEGSLALYRELSAADDVARLTAFLSERDSSLREAAAMEKSANFERALELYRKADSTEGIQRVATLMAKQAESHKEYGVAAEYFETAGLYEDAARVRKTFDANPYTEGHGLTPKEIFRRCAPACVTVLNTAQYSIGSGFFVAPGGYLLTNAHVVAGAEEVQIVDALRHRYDAVVVARSVIPDIALLKATIPTNPVIPIGDSDKVETGAAVAAIGTPESLPQSITNGIISNNDREPECAKGNRCFQINVAINHGNSGGPLIDDAGKVVGINSFGSGTLAVSEVGGIGSDIQNINFAIKINEARSLLAHIKKQ